MAKSCAPLEIDRMLAGTEATRLNARSIRIVLFAVLFLALAPGATVAACLQSGPFFCSCSDTGCPKPNDARVDASSCCEMSDGVSLPRTTPTTALPAAAKPLVDAADRIDTAVATVSSASNIQEIKPDRGLPSPVPLFTLHAALLI